jgi:predicted porin
MNARLTVLCTTTLFCSAAWCQGSVTISGIVDLAARYAHNEGVGSLVSVVSGSNATSRLIFTGREDLGAGWSAGFHLEHGFLADTGTPAASDRLWDRRSTLSLVNKDLGELRMGRDYMPTYTNWSRYDPFSYVGIARSASLISASPVGPIRAAFGTNANTTVRTDNAVQVLLPQLGGWEGGLLVAPGEGGDATFGRAKVFAGRLGYAGKAFSVSAAAATSENSLTTAGKFRDLAVGATADVANVKLSTAWRQFKYDQARQALLLVGAVASFGVHDVKASWVRSELSGRVGNVAIDGNDSSLFGLGYVYNLSKRTALYSTAAYVTNDGAARVALAEGTPAMAAGGSSRGVEVGIRHRF